MNKLIKGVKRFALALCLATPFVSRAAMEFTDPTYTPWDGVSGAVAWRGDGGNFEVSKVADIAADGTIGETYAMAWNNTLATTGKRFCSVCTTTAHQGYVSPGMLLVYDQPGKAASANATFTPLSFGGLWVKALADETEGTPYSVTGSGTRYTDFGVAGVSSYFKFDKSFTVSRSNDIRCYGNVTIDVAEGATFKNEGYNGTGTSLWIENNSTVALQGAGSVELTNGLYLNNSSTLDLSAATRPTIAANVTFPAGATLVVPAGTEPTPESPFTVCSGTLTVSGDIYVKVGDAEATLATVTVDGGAITGFEFPTTEATFDGTTDWPTEVPFGYTYTFIGGETAESAVAVPTGVAVSGTLKTTGYISLTGLEVKNGGTLEVVDGNTTATAATNGYGDKLITGNLIVRAGATLTPTQGDFLDYYYASAQTVDIYGTVAMGATRWTIKASPSQTVNLYPGALVTGTGDAHGVFDLYQSASKLNVYAGENGGEVVIEGVVRTRNANTPIWVAANTTLKIGGLRDGGINKSGNGTLEISGTVASPGASTVSEGTVAFVDTTVAVPLTVNAGKTVTASASEGVTVPLNVTMNASANITVSGAGTVNGTLTFGGKPAGTLTGLTTSTWQGTVSLPVLSAPTALPLNTYGNANSKIVLKGTTGSCYLNGTTTVAAEVVIDTEGDNVVEFNNGNSNQVGTFNKVSGSGTLRLVGWQGCSAATYNLKELDNFKGLAVANNITRDQGGTFTIIIGNIVTADSTEPGACVLPIVNTAVENTTGTVVYNLNNAKLNGEAADLEVKEDGIYVVVPTVTVTVPAIANTTVTVKVGDETIGTAAGDYDVEPDSVVTVTYAAADGYQISGTTEYTIDTASATTFDPSETTQVAQIVAQIRTGATTYEYYTTLAGALASENVAYGITLRADIDEDEVTVSSPVMITGAYTISSDIKIVDGGQLQLMLVTMAGTLTIEENGIYATGGGTLNELVTKDGAKIQLTTLSETAAPLAVTTLSVEGNLTIISSWGSAVRDTYYKALSYVTANADIAEGATVGSVNEWSAKVEAEDDNTVVYLAITKIAVVDGVYYDDAQDAVDAAVESGKPVSFLVAPGTVTLGIGETLVVSGATLPTVELDDGLEAPYEIEHTVDAVNVLNIYTVVKYVAKVKNPVYGTTAWQPEVKYTSLADAVAAVIDNNKVGYDAGYVPLVTLLDNVTLDTRVEPNKRMNIDLNGKTITRTGTSGNGSVFDVKSGIVTIKNGEIDCTQDDTAIVADGVYAITARSGSAVTLEDLTITVDSQAGACVYPFSGATVTINSGTYKNETAEEYQYKTGWTGMAVNQANVTDKLITITGGSFWQVNPEEGDDSGLCTNFLATGRIAKLQDGYWVVQAGTWVAQIEGGAKYETLAAAIGEAVDGDTVELLADVTLDARVEPNLGNGTTLTIDLGGKTITTTATCGNGSAFDVKSGAVTIKNGSINGVEQLAVNEKGNEIAETDAITARSGAVVTLEDLTVTINSQNGACVYPFTGATVTIKSGTYVNNTTVPYQYKTSWTGMAVNQANVAQQLITIYGGSFKQNDPSLGDDSWASAGNGFLASGYASTWNPSTGYYDVAEKKGIDPTDPTSTQEVTPTEQEIEDAGSAVVAAKAKATVTVPEDVATATGVTEETYKSYFTLSATETTPGSGVYEVAVVGLNEAVVFPTSESADLTADLADVLDVDAGAEVAITTAKPGLYYSIEAANSVDFAIGKVEGERELAKTSTVSPAKPDKTGTAVFYRVKVSVTAE